MAAEFKILPCLAQFPLGDPSADVKDEVCRALFGWYDCSGCMNQGSCTEFGCPWKRRAYLSHYLRFYLDITAWSTPADLSEQRYALRSHQDLLSIIRLIKDNPNSLRKELMGEHFSTYGHPQPALTDQKRAFNLAITIIVMIPCSEYNPYYRHRMLDPMLAPASWDDDVSACEFVKSKIPTAAASGQFCGISRTVPRLSVGVLEHAGIKLIGTDDLRQHLLYDPVEKTLQIFHFASFLEELLHRDYLHATMNLLVLHFMVVLD
jgi:hypothetical protein